LKATEASPGFRISTGFFSMVKFVGLLTFGLVSPGTSSTASVVAASAGSGGGVS